MTNPSAAASTPTPLSRPSVCVFCGARPGNNPAHAAAAQEMGRTIATAGWRLVYGAGDVGLMGEVARATQSSGAPTMGVIPTHLLTAERAKQDVTQLVITQDMHERKKVMFMNSDAIVVLPGGGGTLDEFFEVLTWRQLGMHRKPILILNSDGYWDPLAVMIDRIVDQGFAGEDVRGFAQFVADVPALEAALTEGLR